MALIFLSFTLPSFNKNFPGSTRPSSGLAVAEWSPRKPSSAELFTITGLLDRLDEFAAQARKPVRRTRRKGWKKMRGKRRENPAVFQSYVLAATDRDAAPFLQPFVPFVGPDQRELRQGDSATEKMGG